MNALLQVRNLTVSIKHSGLPLLSEVSFALQPGQIVGVVGMSGAGKSILGRTILHLLPPTMQAVGNVLFREEDLLTASQQRLRTLRSTEISALFQFPRESFDPYRPIGPQIYDCMRGTDAFKRERAKQLLEEFGLEDPARCLRSRPFELSGGMIQRIALAAAVANRPKLLIADEPTTALDPKSQSLVIDAILQQKTLGLSVLFISHDIALLSSIADHLIVLDSGKIIEQGPTRDICTKPRHLITQELLDLVLT